jgi:hypothetical protein
MSTAPPVVFKMMSFECAPTPSSPLAVREVAGRRGLAWAVDLIVTAWRRTNPSAPRGA